MGRNPNIIFIHAESLDGRKLGCMGHPALLKATPNIDQLSREGVLFQNAYTNCPVCNPSRASMWTGKYPNYRNCWNNHEGLRDNVRTFRDTFISSGYRTAAIGPLDFKYGKHSIRDRIGSWTRSAMIHRPISRTPFQKVVADGEAYIQDWQWIQKALNELHEAKSDERPFWLYLTTGLVHPPFIAEQRHMDLIEKEGIDIPTLMELEETKHPAITYQRVTKNCDKRFSENLVRQIRHIYFAMIAALDEMVGRVMQMVDDMGFTDSTYVVFSSDHGEMAGDQNQILKRNMYEASARVPLIVKGPGIRVGEIVEKPVSLVDLYPTFMDMANISYKKFSGRPGYSETLDGESLMPQLTGVDDIKRDWVMCEYHGDRACTGTFMIRKENWKYVKHMGFESELFNLENDPNEIYNLAVERLDVASKMEATLTSVFDCEAIDLRAKIYDREQFVKWRNEAKLEGSYRDTMAQVYSGFDQQSIEEISPWESDDEDKIEEWLKCG